jgi:acyl-CoA thioesterase-2
MSNLPRVRPDFRSLVSLEEIETDLYRANTLLDVQHTLYGGQVVAQALLAAGLTVGSGKLPHSLHSYFLRAGDPSLPTLFEVSNDRDGGSFSARRVLARQSGKVIFTMSTSFHIEEEGRDGVVGRMPQVPAPSSCPELDTSWLNAFEGRAVPQPFGEVEWPTRYWARCTDDLGTDPLLHACALAYVSDFSTGLTGLHADGWTSSSSLDHAVWFHRPVVADDWVLVDYEPRSTGAGRGWYRGSFYDLSGNLVATMAQETLFRRTATSSAESSNGES